MQASPTMPGARRVSPAMQILRAAQRKAWGWGVGSFLSYLSGVAFPAIHWPILRFAAAGGDVQLER